MSSKFPTGVSIILPTYDEAGSLDQLLHGIEDVCSKSRIHHEIIIVDDESQGSVRTKEIVEDFQRKNAQSTLVLIMRNKSQRTSLTAALFHGLQHAHHENILIMDADLQHNPEDIPSIVTPVLDGCSEMVTGSRYLDGYDVRDWSIIRRIISLLATSLAYPLCKSTDPMSGFFCSKAFVMQRAKIKSRIKGFKIGLDVLVLGKPKNPLEVPIKFHPRTAGYSKLTYSQFLEYADQLFHLYRKQNGWMIKSICFTTFMIFIIWASNWYIRMRKYTYGI